MNNKDFRVYQGIKNLKQMTEPGDRISYYLQGCLDSGMSQERLDRLIDKVNQDLFYEPRLISKIVDRAWETMEGHYKERIDLIMDIDAANKCCPLKLQELLEADDNNFYHDIIGIGQHMNRQTGKLEDCFIPRFAK